MTTIPLPTEFSELLRSLNNRDVKYLVVGGYAVAYHGYPRATGDIDIWIHRTEENAQRVVTALRDFGFNVPELDAELFLETKRVVRLGHPPLRVEILTSASGVEFETCYSKRIVDELGGVPTSIIGLACLRTNKGASGRFKDLSDLENLPNQTKELGTGTGLATAWLLDGMDKEARLDSVDNDPHVLSIARRHLDADGRITFYECDGEQFIMNASSGTYDLVFADAWPGKYSQLGETLALLKPGGIYVIDDMSPQSNWPSGHEVNVARLVTELKERSDLVVCHMNFSTGVLLCARSA